MTESGYELTEEQWRKVRKRCDEDVWAFSKLIIPEDRGVERFHRPMLYLMAGEAERFFRCYDRRNEYSSAIMDGVDRWCQQWDIPIGTDVGRQIVADVIEKSGVNARISRSMAKTTYAEVATLFWAKADPNDDIGVASKSQPASDKIMEALDNYVLGEAFRTFYPELVPTAGVREAINKSRINFLGRSRATQSTIEGRGLLMPWTGRHYRKVWGDDIVGLESGDASIEDALRWIAALRGISKARVLGGTRRLFTGTRYESGDDHGASHQNDPTLLSIVIPIWEKPAYDLENLMTDGVPVLPEWYDVGDIRDMRKQTLAAEGGAIAWLNNFELTTLEDAEKKITPELINRQLIKVVKVNGREIWVRRDADNREVEIDPNGLDYAAGLDQAVSEHAWADQWVFGLVGQDRGAHRYLVDGIGGKGYESMLAQVLPRWRTWGEPRRVGIDVTGAQIITTDLMKREPIYQRFSACIEEVSATTISKSIRIMNYIVAGLRGGWLWIHPRLLEFRAQAIKWNPSSPRAKRPGTDDWLDSFSIACEVLQSVPVTDEELERSKFAAYTEREEAEGRSLPETVAGGIDLYSILGMEDF